MTKIGLIGTGNYGFALASHLDRKHDPNLELTLYDHKPEVMAHLQQTGMHPKFFPTTKLSAAVRYAPTLPELVAESEIVILATVSTALEDVLGQIKPVLTQPLIIVSVMKALDNDTGLPLTSVIGQQLAETPAAKQLQLAVLAGGTTGRALTQEEYLGITLACPDLKTAKYLQQVFQSPFLRVQLATDVLGVQYAGSFKNLISVLVGLTRGLGFGYGTQTHVLSLAASEAETLAVSLGAQKETFSFASQCWGNDLVMSATNPETRNFTLGLLLGEGSKFPAATAKMQAEGKTAESVNTIQILPQIADLAAYPLFNFLSHLAREEVAAHEIVKIIEGQS
jgi:glycerol-3-phosphate dehydrogenase (NAD(P)+)